jgi:YVTN family beta-propeller protein
MKMNTPARHRLAALTTAVLLASCGGGDPETPAADTAPAPSSAGSRATPQAVFTPTTPIPADANQRGMWGPVTAWPVISVHTVLMPDGRVLTFGTDTTGRQTGFFNYDVWDPEQGFGAGSHQTIANSTGTDIFCSSQLVLPGGSQVFIAGGDNWTGTATTNTGNNNSNLFTLSNNSLQRGINMNRARWYSSSTTLLNGETYIQGGSSGTDRPEVRQTDGTFRLLSGANTGSLDFMYPRNFIAPDGRVFGYDSNGQMYYVNTSGTGSIALAGTFSGPTGSDASAAMFRPGRILQFGGNSNGARVIDIRGASPSVTVTQSMSTQRRLVNATVLADGKVLATGGSRTWNALDQVNNAAEIWNPDTGTWTLGASGVQARLYHSGAILLPDASVLVLGGGAPGPQNNTNVELYFPPYLFGANGTLAPRLAITSAPTVTDIGRTFNVDLAGGSAARVVMVKTGSVTHSWNMEQRFVELTFQQNGNRLAVQAPTRAADAPPGFYLLFVIDANGVPSVAKTVRVNVAATPNPAVTPSITSPGDQATVAGTAVSLQLQASDPNGDPLAYSASGLPLGLALNPATGAIGGAPTSPGSYNVVVTASDGVNAASASFTWTVTSSAPFTLSVPVLPAATTTGATATFTASANGTNTRYKWDFGDGSPETAWSASPSATHTYTAPGLYQVTVTAVDDRGIELRQTVLQGIHLPLTAGKPASSSNIAIENLAGGDPRIWVINQDNDSVSVFNLASGAKLAEVTVGTAPRGLAVAGNGRVFVTNKQSATVSVISTSTFAVIQTIALPRGSQPFGIAVSGSSAYVVTEALGRLLRYDTGSYAQTGSLDIGANARHVSISADGATAYVSRFITPPVPGEATTAPQLNAGGAGLLRVATGSMSLAGATGLSASTLPDAENQGRGIPNYVGAAAISPDGTSAWVPSKLDNIARGAARDGSGLNFQNTVRAISSRLVLASGSEDAAARIDHDNASLASAAIFDAKGLYLFVALETSREVAVVDAHGKRELFRFEVGLAPQGLALSPNGLTLAVSNFMSRSVSLFDLTPLLQQGLWSVNGYATLNAVGSEKIGANVLRGKQLFYDARDTRLARDRYMSCASCHNDGGQDGRVWDLTGFGEGLRNTIALRGRGGMGQGFLHWSNNFDEVQDFEGQIRALAGGTGLMNDADFLAGTRSQPLGDAKAGRSADLDALAAYLASLNTFEPSPYRPSAAALSSAASAGRSVFQAKDCASCHAGTAFTLSGTNNPRDVGTTKPASGGRLGSALAGIDVPTLRDVWATAPYLHDGSAATLDAAVRAHNNVSVTDAELANLVAYLREIGSDESTAPAPGASGTGLRGQYFNNVTLSGTPVLTRVEAVNFGWGSGSPGTGVNSNNFSVRWSGTVYAPTTGNYRFQSVSDDGVRLWVNGTQRINNWSDHAATTNTSANIALTGGQFYTITMEYYEKGGQAVARLRWLTPGTSSYVPIPAANLFAP